MKRPRCLPLPDEISTYWRPGEAIVVDLAPETPLERALLDAKQSRRSVGAVLADRLRRWELTPDGTEGYRKAEVTAGGVDTRELDSRSGESRRIPGLYFIGEVVDVTGWLGGYNFQWAWASAAACARALGANCSTGRGGL